MVVQALCWVSIYTVTAASCRGPVVRYRFRTTFEGMQRLPVRYPGASTSVRYDFAPRPLADFPCYSVDLTSLLGFR